MDHATRLYNRILNVTDAEPKLTYSRIMQILRDECDRYIASISQNTTPSSGTSTKGTVSSKKSGGSAATVSWPKIFLSKEYGVIGYFKIHQKVNNTDKMKHHDFIKHLRQTYEGTAEWDDYVEWVRGNHPEGSSLIQDPPKFVSK